MGAGGHLAHDLQVSSEGSKFRFLGLSLKQTVVIALITYALITAVFVGKHFKNPESEEAVVTHNKNLLLKLHGEKSKALSDEGLLEDVVLDVANSSSLQELGRVAEDGTEDDDRYYELRNSMYHSSVVFQLNYEEMLAKFKIFVYPGDAHSFKVLSGETSTDEISFTDELFVHQLYQSDFVTLDPEVAPLLFLPISLRAVAEDSHVGTAGKFLNKYVESIRVDYPYWSRTLGADHVTVACTEAKEDGSRNVLELRKNTIQVACSPLTGSQTFYPHKDVSMPSYHAIPPPPADAEGERSTLAYYSGPTGDESLYASLDVSWQSDPSFLLESENVESVHYKLLATSKFCLILGSQDYGNIASALKYGCVPVLVSDGKLYDLPFQDVLNWSQFVVVVSRKNVQKVKSMLANFDNQQYIAMQYLGKEASKHLEWHTPPQDQDAFYMVIYDLWVRRHSIRYVRRDEL